MPVARPDCPLQAVTPQSDGSMKLWMLECLPTLCLATQHVGHAPAAAFSAQSGRAGRACSPQSGLGRPPAQRGRKKLLSATHSTAGSYTPLEQGRQPPSTHNSNLKLNPILSLRTGGSPPPRAGGAPRWPRARPEWPGQWSTPRRRHHTPPRRPRLARARRRRPCAADASAGAALRSGGRATAAATPAAGCPPAGWAGS